MNNTINISKKYVYTKSVQDGELKICLKINLTKSETTNGTLYLMHNGNWDGVAGES